MGSEKSPYKEVALSARKAPPARKPGYKRGIPTLKEIRRTQRKGRRKRPLMDQSIFTVRWYVMYKVSGKRRHVIETRYEKTLREALQAFCLRHPKAIILKVRHHGGVETD